MKTVKAETVKPKKTERPCEVCRRPYRPAAPNGKYCSKACRKQAFREARRKRREQKGKGRPLTELAVYLSHKWTAEGMTVKEIAAVLNRSRERVEEALKIPLSPKQKHLLKVWRKEQREERRLKEYE